MRIRNNQPLISDIVERERYPIDRLESVETRRLIDWCQTELRTQGAFSLPGFLTSRGLAECVLNATAIAPEAYYSSDRHNPIFSKDDPSLPSEHPWRHFESKQVGFVGNDMIAPDAVVQRLYDWPVLTSFLAATLGYGTLHTFADPVAALSINVMGEGDHLGWHFDTNDFVVTMPLQLADSGGQYEYCPYIWDRESPEWQWVSKTLSGDRRLVQSLAYEPGSLVVFCGRYSLHRVTAVEGATKRLVAILSYHHAPGAMLSEWVRMQVYGKLS